MSEYDLTTLSANDVVLHFGGRPNEVDAFTFSNALVALSEAMQEINAQLNTNHSVSISIEGLGEGSFRAKVSPRFKSLGGMFARGSRDFLINIFASFVFASSLDTSKPIEISVTGDQVVIHNGNDRIIMPRNVWEARRSLKHPKAITRHIAKAFEVLEDDPCVLEFGLASGMKAKEVGIIHREHFHRLARPLDENHGDKTHVDTDAIVTVLKIIFEDKPTKWQFIWNGIKISASMKDEVFLSAVGRGEVSFRQGDSLFVTMRIHQTKDHFSGVFVNRSYEILKVHEHKERATQSELFR